VLRYRATIKRYVTLAADGESVRTLRTVETGVLCRLEDQLEGLHGDSSSPHDAVAYFLLTTDLRPRGSESHASGDIVEINRIAYEVLSAVDSDALSHRLVAKLRRIGPASESHEAGSAGGRDSRN
jgi:hypothetical protein